jgi:hypothetical protein
VFSPDQWEDFTAEWAHSLKDRYHRVERCGGAGDLGRDVIAWVSQSEWHNYQCKHYRDPLMPSQVVLELGKFCFHLHEEAFTPPTEYYFVAPQGVGNKLSQLLRDPVSLRERLIIDWPQKCENHITSGKKVPLTGSLLEFIQSFEFSIFDYVPPLDLLEQHRTTRWHAARFPLGLPCRPKTEVPPLDQETFTSPYIERLLEAYSDHEGPVLSVDMLRDYPELHDHLLRSRERFFHAEALRVFSRDNLPPTQFSDLQEEFYDGVIDNIRDTSHADGYRRVTSTTALARQLDPTNNALRQVLSLKDKAGICHQLADDGRLTWVMK